MEKKRADYRLKEARLAHLTLQADKQRHPDWYIDGNHEQDNTRA